MAWRWARLSGSRRVLAAWKACLRSSSGSRSSGSKGSAPSLVDGWGVKFQAAVACVLKTSSNSMGVSLPRRACRRRRW